MPLSMQNVEITEIHSHDEKVEVGDTSQQNATNKKRHFIHQGNHVTVIEGENVSTMINGYPLTTMNQNINYNSLERGTRRKLPQVPNGTIHGTAHGTSINGNVNSDLYTHSLPRKAKGHASSSRYVLGIHDTPR